MIRRFLRVDRGASAGAQFDLGSARAVLGRGQRASHRFEDPGASREHCAVEVEGDVVRVVDLDSKNGTSVNGMPIETQRLSPGDRIEIGHTTIVYFEEEEETAVGDLSFESIDDEEVSETLSLSLDSVGIELGASRADLWQAGAVCAIHRAGILAQEARSIEALFGGVLEILLDQGVATEAAVALFDPETGEVTDRVTAPAGGRLVVGKRLLDGVRRDREVVRIDEGRAGQLVGAPLWIDRRVDGILCARLPEGLRQIGRRALEFVGVLGTIVGGAVGTLHSLRTLEKERRTLETDLQSQYDMVGRSPAMKNVFRLIEKIAPTETTVLIRGESGTGKELVARAIHYRSNRRGGPFVAVNAAALPIELVESDLFGHEKGAFTGAVDTRQGRFELADGGTFFLDEIADLDPRVQAKFLRVLEDGCFQRVGGTETIETSTRIIAATNRDLSTMVREGAFREDLYYRLRVLEIVLPPLRERPGDVEHLVRHFLARFAEEMGRRGVEIEDEAMARLVAFSWPGNVRELKNCIERAVVLSGSGLIERTHFEFLPDPRADRAEIRTLRDVEREHIRRVLEETGGNKSKAARLLGIDRSTLYQKLKEMGD